MKLKITSVPELLVQCYGNQSEVARRLGINRALVSKLVNDTECEYHAVVNGRFMTVTRYDAPDVYNPSKHTPEHKPGRKPKYGPSESSPRVAAAKELVRRIGFL